MAEAASTTDIAVPEQGNHANNRPAEESRTRLADALGNINVMRQIIIILALAVSLGIAVFVMIWVQEPEMRPLPQMDNEEMLATLDYFDQNQIPYKVERNIVMIPSERYQEIQLNLNRAGVSQAPTDGSEILMQDMGFGVSQRLERERLKHSREQILARTIEELRSIKRARVLLAIPKETVFAKRQKRPSATVVVTLQRGSALKQEEVDSIVDIIASAVNGMEPSRVTVTDQNGRLLNSGSQSSVASRTRKEFEIGRQREQEYLNKIDTILIPVVGLGNYTAQVDVTMDFTSTEQTQRRFNPDLPALRSERTYESHQVGSGVAGIPGALSNQPPLDSDIPENAVGESSANRSGSGQSQAEATRNYELDTTISHTRKQVGVVSRVSVSVAVDYVGDVNPETGERALSPRSQEELNNIRRLLQGGLGFNVQRGDTLEVVTIPFVSEETFEPVEVPLYEQPWFWQVARLAAGILIVLILVLFVARPMLKKLMTADKGPSDEELGLLEGPVAADLEGDLLAASDSLDEQVNEELIGSIIGGKVQLPDLHKDEDVLKAVRSLVANEPELSIQVVKGWLAN